jgi:hypothetical protein
MLRQLTLRAYMSRSLGCFDLPSLALKYYTAVDCYSSAPAICTTRASPLLFVFSCRSTRARLRRQLQSLQSGSHRLRRHARRKGCARPYRQHRRRRIEASCRQPEGVLGRCGYSLRLPSARTHISMVMIKGQEGLRGRVAGEQGRTEHSCLTS